jgi:hypothetical protein
LVLKEHTFFLLDFQYALSAGDYFIPNEIAILAFSFAEGEKATFHRFIDPGTIPRCYLIETLWQTSQIHGIPHHNFNNAEKNYSQLYNDIAQFFLQYLDQANPILAIYTKVLSLVRRATCLLILGQI